MARRLRNRRNINFATARAYSIRVKGDEALSRRRVRGRQQSNITAARIDFSVFEVNRRNKRA